MYYFDGAVRYSELNEEGRMSLPSVLNRLQDCCTFDSEEIGMGLQYLRQEHRAWVLSFWQVVIERYPELGEPLRTFTWPYDFKGFLGYRNFKIEDGAGEAIAFANSVWTYLDTQTGLPARVSEEVKSRYVFDPPYEMARAGRKLRTEADMRQREPFRVKRWHLDTNRHMNNVKYIMAAQEYLPEGFKVRELRAEYKRAAVLSDVICPRVKELGERILVSLDQETGTPYTVAEFWKMEE